jgi:WD40 repeat protein
VNDVKFDTNNPNRLVTCAEDNTVRIWTTENGIFLTQEHQIHRSGVKSIDWNVHDKNVMVSGGSDSKVIASSLSQITQVREFKNLKGELEVCLRICVLIAQTEKVIPTRPRRPTSKL